ncbi:hypothetical protein CC2G_000487 [Coprinopsis cinerea AmutBmut pab1-1]|nr:hypothetical protein CC2G_000487 [Coprinopsis cinerea AmutBmut pab1-1]
MNRALKPKGLLILSEFDFFVYGADFQRIELSVTELEPPWWPRWMTVAREAAQTFGGSVDAATHLYDWVAGHPGFEEVVYRDFWIPCSPWCKENPLQMKYGEVMREDILAFIKSGRPLLLSRGHPHDTIDFLSQKASEELMEAKQPGYIRVQNVYARRKVNWKPPPKPR